MTERNEILKNYANLVARIWENEELVGELQAEPRKVLSNFGLDVPQEAEINLFVREMNVDGSPTTQVDMWAEGEETGVYNIVIPLKPEGFGDLQDIPLSEELLEIVAGGNMGAAGCCCPCTSCPCCWDLAAA